MAATAVALKLGISDEAIVAGFERFEGVKRRFTKVGEADGAIVIGGGSPITRLKSGPCWPPPVRAERAGDRGGEPHRFTRLQALMDEFQNAFNDADVVLVAPVYPAGEEPIEGVNSSGARRRAPRARPRMVDTVDRSRRAK